MKRQLIVPAPVCPGDVVRVIAPAGIFDRTLFWRGLGWLSEHVRVRFDRGVFERSGLFAGDDQRRADELHEALQCPDSRAIVAARGGAGCTRLLRSFDRAALRAHPKWLVGFSDITALHCEWARAGVGSLHAHNLTALGRGDAEERGRWLAALTTPTAPRQRPVEMLTPGSATGPLCGGNLAVLHDVVAGEGWAPPVGGLLFLEEVAEPPYRIDRMLGALERHGVFDRLSGVLVGSITSSVPGPGAVDARRVFSELGARTGLPVAWGYPAGHERRNDPLPLGLLAELRAGTFSILDG